MTLDEQTLYFFAFRHALPRQSYTLSLVSDLVLRRVDEFEDWHLIDRDVQRLFRDRLQKDLLERSIERGA